MTKQETQAPNIVRPFLRWAGGKSWLIHQLSNHMKIETYNHYHEPFVGGGAIFFYLNPTNISFLSDLNSELIDSYLCIKEDVNGVIRELRKFKNTKDFYYKIRAKQYKSDLKRTARFIYLNQTSFNGIYRVNLNGDYNVPYGYRKKEYYLDTTNLILASNRLQKSIISQGDYIECLESIRENDLVYLDPPYTITHNNNGFFKYNAKLFSKEDQYRLSEMIDEIKNRNAYYILSNAANETVKQIFDKEDKLIELKRASVIGGRNSKRSKYAEIIVTNLI